MRFKKAESINWHFGIVHILDRISFSYIQLIDWSFQILFFWRSYDVLCELPEDFQELHDEVHKLIFKTCLRLATHKEDKVIGCDCPLQYVGMHVCSTVGHIQTCFSHLIFLTSPFKRRKQGYIDNITCKNMERQISLLLFVSFLIKLLFFNWIFF